MSPVISTYVLTYTVHPIEIATDPKTGEILNRAMQCIYIWLFSVVFCITIKNDLKDIKAHFRNRKHLKPFQCRMSIQNLLLFSYLVDKRLVTFSSKISLKEKLWQTVKRNMPVTWVSYSWLFKKQTKNRSPYKMTLLAIDVLLFEIPS